MCHKIMTDYISIVLLWLFLCLYSDMKLIMNPILCQICGIIIIILWILPIILSDNIDSIIFDQHLYIYFHNCPHFINAFYHCRLNSALH